MDSISLKSEVVKPTHVVECNGGNQYAYTLSRESKTFSRMKWDCDGEDDASEIAATNAQLPQNCTKLQNKFTAKFGKVLSEFYLGKDFIVGFEDLKIFGFPDALFLQRVSPYTKTFDLVCFYSKTPVIFSVLDRKDLDVVRDWYSKKIYSCSADPLPMSFVEEFLKHAEGDDIYEQLFNELFKVEESSASEYEQSSESDEDYESDDAYESSGGEQEVSEYESDGEEAEFDPAEEEEEDEEEEEEEEEEQEPTKKKRKMF